MRGRITAVAVAALMMLGACSTDDAVMTLAELPHAHNVVIVEGDIFVGTHHGLYRFSESQGFIRMSDDFDVMGLATDGDVFYASGHPGPGFTFPDPVGLLVSEDRGESWQPVSLTGEVDFHLLDTAGDVMVGAAANYGVMVMSADRGVSWNSVDWPGLTDFSLNPQNPTHIILATGEGPLVSTDSGNSFDSLTNAPPAFIVDWSADGLTAIAGGRVFVSGGPGQPFESIYEGVDNPIDVARSGHTIAVVDGHSLLVSRDSGATFTRY